MAGDNYKNTIDVVDNISRNYETPWYVRNDDLRKNLSIKAVKEEIERFADKYKERLSTRKSLKQPDYQPELIELANNYLTLLQQTQTNRRNRYCSMGLYLLLLHYRSKR